MKRVYAWLICVGILTALGGCSLTAVESMENTPTQKPPDWREKAVKSNVFMDIPSLGLYMAEALEINTFPHANAEGERVEGRLYFLQVYEEDFSAAWGRPTVVVDPGESSFPVVVQQSEGLYPMLYCADITGDGYPEIILNFSSSARGVGWSEIYRYVPGADTLEAIKTPWDAGFTGDYVLGDKTATLTNSYTGETVTVEASLPCQPNEYGYGEAVTADFPAWRDTQPVDIDSDGVYELATLFGEDPTISMTAGIGYATTLLRYDEAVGDMKVYKAGILSYQQVESNGFMDCLSVYSRQ